MNDYTIFYHDGGPLFAGDDINHSAGWFVWANGEYHAAEMCKECRVTMSMLADEVEA